MQGWHLHSHLEDVVARAGFGRDWPWAHHGWTMDADGILQRTPRVTYRRPRNAVEEENYRARKRARRRNGSPK